MTPPQCIGLDDPRGPGGDPDFPGPIGIVANNTSLLATAASFTAGEAESVTLVRRWAHTNMVDEPIGFEAYTGTSGPGSGSVRELLLDRQNSVLFVVDGGSDSVLAEYLYDGYGQPLQVQGDLLQPFGYNGREYDGESGLTYMRARYYDPRVGVFIQSDPLGFEGDGLNIHAYVMQMPFAFRDPTGLAVMVDGMVGTGIRAAGSGSAVWSVGVGVASVVNRILGGLRTATALFKAYDAATSFPGGKEPNHCDEKGSPMHQARARIRSMYKPLESMPRSCSGLSWDSVGDVMDRFSRARTGYKLAALRKLELALCHDGGDEVHRSHVQRAIDTARACTSRP